ncbi:hypothetical protein [Clostridium botulinum]|uniref:hypothetical protein n=1 Tax=Clostridium botulinum TaxID=1491 RepID=UPI001FAC8783|nr:hypothetical protein [Clostridium botulinum]
MSRYCCLYAHLYLYFFLYRHLCQYYIFYSEYHQLTVKGYDNNRKVICTETISLKVPNAITNPSAEPVLSGSFTVTAPTVSREYPRSNASVTRNLKQGDKVDVYAVYGDWYLVARGTPQWVEKQYLTR